MKGEKREKLRVKLRKVNLETKRKMGEYVINLLYRQKEEIRGMIEDIQWLMLDEDDEYKRLTPKKPTPVEEEK